jgi:hypothetical protein
MLDTFETLKQQQLLLTKQLQLLENRIKQLENEHEGSNRTLQELGWALPDR